MKSIFLPGLALLLSLTSTTLAQENQELGRMWTFENPPLAYLEEEYGFKPDQEWLNSLRLGSQRFGALRGLDVHDVHAAHGQEDGGENILEDGNRTGTVNVTGFSARASDRLKPRLRRRRMVVSHMSLYGQIDGCSVELLGARSTSDPPGVNLTRVLRNPGSLLVRTLRIPAANVFGKGGNIRRVLLSAPFGAALTAAPPYLGVLKALSLGTLKCLALHENPLSLIPIAGPTKANNNGVELRVFAGAPREGSITSWEEV